MTVDLLEQIKVLQYTDRSKAEALVSGLIEQTFALEVASVELRPLAVSLNSFNGFLHLTNGTKLFFKTHTEPDNVISEYYHASALKDAGYPVLQPLYSSTEAGRQLLIYEVIEAPSVFDVAWAIENGDESLLLPLTKAQYDADDLLMKLYERSLAPQDASRARQAAIHQLFYHRLVSGRLERFYGPLPSAQARSSLEIALPGGRVPLAQVRNAQWEINGQIYAESIDDIIQRALVLLEPSKGGPSVVGHGDAHNGNVFLLQADTVPSLLYFDPAFAGRHHPLLDLAKPLFHNVFAMWMYFPLEKRDQLTIRFEKNGKRWKVEHDYRLPAVREMFLESKVERVLIPIMQRLASEGMLQPDWRAYLKAALFCCPFLTMNLSDATKFPPEITLLGLTMAVEMGSESAGKRSRIDSILDSVSQAL